MNKMSIHKTDISAGFLSNVYIIIRKNRMQTFDMTTIGLTFEILLY